MKTYLVTGCAGFIGSNFVHYMLEKYQDIRLVNLDKLTYAGNLENLEDIKDDARHIFVKGDICDKALVTDLIAKYDPDYVINFAAESHVDRSIRNPEIFVESNVLGTVNLLQCCKDAWYDADAKTWKEGKKYLQVSTDEVYGALGAEGYFMETTPLCPHSPYSASKASADMFVKAFHDTYGMPINITRCSNNYGPYQFPEKLIPLLINNAKHHKTLPVYGDGMQIRDWLYVMDHCKAIDMVANGGKDGEVYNVGAGAPAQKPGLFQGDQRLHRLSGTASGGKAQYVGACGKRGLQQKLPFHQVQPGSGGLPQRLPGPAPGGAGQAGAAQHQRVHPADQRAAGIRLGELFFGPVPQGGGSDPQ